MPRPVPVIPAKLAAVRAHLDGVISPQSPHLLNRAREFVAPLPEDHVVIGAGFSSFLAAGFNAALFRAGLKKYIGISRDRATSLGSYMGLAMEGLARENGVDFTFLDTSALIAGTDSEDIPEPVLEALRRSGARSVSFVESVALGYPLPPPGSPLTTVDLTEGGRFRRIQVRPGTDAQRQQTIDNMGRNPTLWLRKLAERNLLDGAHSFAVSFSSWIREPWYGFVGEAKEELQRSANQHLDELRDTLVRYRVGMCYGDFTPALGKIPAALLFGLQSVHHRALLGDTLSSGELGLHLLLATLDEQYTDPSLEREGALIRFDMSERKAFPAILREIDDLGRMLPADLPLGEELSQAESDRIIRDYLRWHEDWRRHLRPLQLLRVVEVETPPPLPAVPPSPAPEGAGPFGDALVAEGEPTAAGVPFGTPPPAPTIRGPEAPAAGNGDDLDAIGDEQRRGLPPDGQASMDAMTAHTRGDLPPVLAKYFDDLFARTEPGVTPDGDTFRMEHTFTAAEVWEYAYDAVPSGLARHTEVYAAMTFVAAFPAILQAMKDPLSKATRKTAIHAGEDVTIRQPIGIDETVRIEVSRQVRKQMVTLSRKIFGKRNLDGTDQEVLLAEGKTTLIIGPDLTQSGEAPNVEIPEVKLHPVRWTVSGSAIDRYARVTGDFQLVHMSDEAAKALGLPGRILHGMAEFKVAEEVLMNELRNNGLAVAGALKARFHRPVPVDDRLDFLPVRGENDCQVFVRNQWGEVTMTLSAKTTRQAATGA